VSSRNLTPRPRLAARVITVNGHDQALLFETIDAARPDRESRWISPGGGLEDGETFVDGALRELEEETGFRADVLVGPVGTSAFIYSENGEAIAQEEEIFVVFVGNADLAFDGWTDWERTFMRSARWWGRDELEAGSIKFFPKNLFELVDKARSELSSGA